MEKEGRILSMESLKAREDLMIKVVEKYESEI